MSKADYPAAHSQDTGWFAIDDAGEVAYMDTGENGPIPPNTVCGISYFDMFDHLEKDEYDVRIFPTEHDFFVESESRSELSKILASITEEEREMIIRLASKADLSSEEKLWFQEIALKHKLGSRTVLVLTDASDSKELEKSRHIIRLDSSKPIYFVIAPPLGRIFHLLIEGRLLEWKEVSFNESDFLGLSNVHGIYFFEADYWHDNLLKSWEYYPSNPPRYVRKHCPKQPRNGLPRSLLNAVDKRTVGEHPENISLPFAHSLPGAHFAEMPFVQIADFVPCYSWGNGHLTPDSNESRLRRNIAAVDAHPREALESLASTWREASEQGDLVASWSMAYLYAVMHSPGHENVIHWLQKTVEYESRFPRDKRDVLQSGAAAKFLAELYEQGKWVSQDLTLARHWYLRAATLENSVAQYQLGMMLAKGVGGPVDKEQARNWLSRAAEKDMYYKSILANFRL